jgi:hypothetical protein
MSRRPLLHPPQQLRGRAPAKVIERFFAKVKVCPDHGCWLWQACLDEGGYPRFWFRGRSRGAHRVSWAIFRGTIPAHKEVDHRNGCAHNCVNPDHLCLKTHVENSRDGRRRQMEAAAELADLPI